MLLSFGDTSLDVRESYPAFSRVLLPSQSNQGVDFQESMNSALEDLALRIREAQPRRIAILVEDQTRRNPDYPRILGPLIQQLKELGCARPFLIAAYGTHRPHTLEEHRRCYGAEVCEAVDLVDHDGRDASRLVEVGQLPGGRPLRLCREAVEADFRIVCGSVEPHVFAGFTGGRKMILPGIAARENIDANHGMVARPGTQLGQLENNPIHLEMAEAPGLLPIHFAIQTVRDAEDRLVAFSHGELDSSWRAAVKACRMANTVKIDALADFTLVCVGGRPKDRSLYQSHRALAAGVKVTRPGGDVLLVGALDEGAGHPLVEDWLSRPRSELLDLRESCITAGLHNAYLVARRMEQCRVRLFCTLSEQQLKKLQLTGLASIDAWIQECQEHHGAESISYLIPNGSSILPIGP